MPSNQRTHLKRKLANALHDLDLSVQHLIDLHEVFAPVEPELADFLDMQITTLLTVREWMLDFWALAWGARPEDYERWR